MLLQIGNDEALTKRLYESCALASDRELGDAWLERYPLASLFAYRGPVRELILDFKVSGRWQSGYALARIFAEHSGVHSWVKAADYLMPVPSSFWGRWRGKHDLAFALAESLSLELGIPLIKAPRRKYFRWSKQSFLSRSERLRDAVRKTKILSVDDLLQLSRGAKDATNLAGAEGPLIVLIDDIVTSGKTLTGLAGAFRNMRFRFLTLASAYHSSPKD